MKQPLIMMPDNFQDALKVKTEMEASLDYVGKSWKTWQASYAIEQGIPEKGPMGLTNDLIKSNPKWTEHYQLFNKSMKIMQNFNRVFVKKFKKEYSRYVQAKRNSKN